MTPRTAKPDTTYTQDAPGTCSHTIRGIDRKVWKALRQRSVELDTTASEIVKALIVRYVEEE